MVMSSFSLQLGVESCLRREIAWRTLDSLPEQKGLILLATLSHESCSSSSAAPRGGVPLEMMCKHGLTSFLTAQASATGAAIDLHRENCSIFFQMKRACTWLCTLEQLLIMHVMVLQIYERAAITRWISTHHTVPHSPAQPAHLHDLKPCPKMQRLLKRMRREYGLRLQAPTGLA